MLRKLGIAGNPSIAPQCGRCEHNPANYPGHANYDEHNDFAFHADRELTDREPTDAGPYEPPSQADREWWAAHATETVRTIGDFAVVGFCVGDNRIGRLSAEARRRIEEDIRGAMYLEADREREYRRRLEEEEEEMEAMRAAADRGRIGRPMTVAATAAMGGVR